MSVEGEPLSTRLKAAPIPWQRALQLGRQIASALAAVHAKGIVHGDLAPDHVLIVRDPDVPGGERIKLLEAGDANRVSTRADLQSLGCVVYELVTGRPPSVEGAGDVLTGGEVPPSVERLIRRMLATSPNDGIQSATALIEAIDRELRNTRPSQQLPPIPTAISHIGSGPVIALPMRPPTSSGSVNRTASSKKLLVPILLGSAAIIAVVAFFVVSHENTAEPPEPPGVKLATEPAPKVDTPQVTTPAPTAVNLDVASDPAGARVFLDGALLGTTPFHGHLPIGTVEKELVVKAAGFVDKKLAITPDHAIDEVVTLTKIAGKKP